jgi:ABC-2 type transport system permease protein
VRSLAPATPLDGSSDGLRTVGRFAQQVFAIAAGELEKLRRDPTEVFTRSLQPILWLLVFGEVFTRVRAIPTGTMRYLDFMAPGVLAQSVLFTAIFYGIAVIWERDLGIVHKMLVSPAYRSALVLGKAVAAGVRGLSQTAIIYVVALLLGVQLRFEPLPALGVVFCVLLGSAVFSTFSLIIACVVKTRERFMGIGQVLTMPLFFASNAIYPIAMMPGWLRVVAHGNPLTYLVDALRALMVQGGHSAFGLALDMGVELAALVVLVAIAARLYPSVAR